MKNAFFGLFIYSLCCLSACKEECNPEGNCALIPDSGDCEAAIPRYYFDKDAEECK